MKVAVYIGIGKTDDGLDARVERLFEDLRSAGSEVCVIEAGADLAGCDFLLSVGGDGTFRGATDLTAHGIPCVGIPGTIDNDIASTDNTIGFYTAMNTVIELVDRLRDTCESHARCNVVEVMGRGAGDIALNTAIASGASAVVIPEVAHNDDDICAKINESRKTGKRNFIVIVSEGVGSEYAPALAKKIEAREYSARLKPCGAGTIGSLGSGSGSRKIRSRRKFCTFPRISL